jgi:hypothetical protein
VPSGELKQSSFVSVNEMQCSSAGRLSASNYVKRVNRMNSIWERWSGIVVTNSLQKDFGDEIVKESVQSLDADAWCPRSSQCF